MYDGVPMCAATDFMGSRVRPLAGTDRKSREHGIVGTLLAAAAATALRCDCKADDDKRASIKLSAFSTVAASAVFELVVTLDKKGETPLAHRLLVFALLLLLPPMVLLKAVP